MHGVCASFAQTLPILTSRLEEKWLRCAFRSSVDVKGRHASAAAAQWFSQNRPNPLRLNEVVVDS
jgi:hypothetical protein